MRWAAFGTRLFGNKTNMKRLTSLLSASLAAAGIAGVYFSGKRFIFNQGKNRYVFKFGSALQVSTTNTLVNQVKNSVYLSILVCSLRTSYAS